MADIYLTIRPKSQNIAHSWNTKIMETVKGEETRSALHTWPRLDCKQEFISSNDPKTNWFRRNLFKYKHKIWGIPIWHDLTPLRGIAAVGQLNIPVTETANRHFYAGRNAILIDKTDFTNYEVIKVNSVSATTIAASSLLSDSWNKDTTYFMPVYDFRLGNSFNINRYNAKADNLTLDATEDLTVLTGFSYSTPTIGATYLGHPIFEYVVQADKSQNFIHPNLSLKDIGLQAVESWFDEDDTHMVNNFNLLTEGRANIWEILNFFDHRLGKYNTFWMPTWNRDLTATVAITAGATLINVADYEYDTLFAGNVVINRHLFIGLPDRSYVCRKIISATANTITLNEAIGTPLRAIELDHVLFSFMNFSRFGSDRLEIDYIRGELASFRQTTMGLIKEIPPAAIENLLTYASTDPEGRYTITESTCTFTDMERDDIEWLAKDFGAAYFGDFEVDFEFEITDIDNVAVAILFGVADTLGTFQDMQNAGEGITFYGYGN
ncbi:MAG: hypothetical protein KAS39_04390, partial [Actinomycetia bacterium]|nr:hypothetical protein [Actinomycetes bacterium]